MGGRGALQVQARWTIVERSLPSGERVDSSDLRMNANGLGLSEMEILVSLRLSLVRIIIIVFWCGLLMSMYFIDGPTFYLSCHNA